MPFTGLIIAKELLRSLTITDSIIAMTTIAVGKHCTNDCRDW